MKNIFFNKSNRYYIITTVHIIIWLLFVMLVYKKVMLPAINAGNSFGITNNSRETIINDFPSHFNFAKEVWLSKADRNSVSSVYSVENHLQVTSKWAGSKVTNSLSFGYSPTMLWLLAPLVFFSHGSAFSIFNLIGLWSIWWQSRPVRCRNGFGILPFLSPISCSCLMLGQTALFNGACLLFIAENSQKQSNDARFKKAIYTGIALWVLTAKPPLAITAGAVLISLRKWQPILVALFLTIVMTVAISPLLGANWINDYITLIAGHNLVDADKAFAFCYYPPHMANLRAILNVDFQIADNIASRISTLAWICSLACMMTIGAGLRLEQTAYWAMGIILYLLFCPHVSSTEELQLIFLIPLCIPVIQKKLNSRELTLFALLLLLPFMSPVGPFFLNVRWGLFTAKIVLIAFVLYYYWEKRNQTAPVTACCGESQT